MVGTPAGARMPAKSAVTIPVRKANWVSTSIATRSAAAANGMANDQIVGSFIGALFIWKATLSLTVTPTRINAVSTMIAEPTSANAFRFERASPDVVLRCSVNFQAAQYTAATT